MEKRRFWPKGGRVRSADNIEVRNRDRMPESCSHRMKRVRDEISDLLQLQQQQESDWHNRYNQLVQEKEEYRLKLEQLHYQQSKADSDATPSLLHSGKGVAHMEISSGRGRSADNIEMRNREQMAEINHLQRLCNQLFQEREEYRLKLDSAEQLHYVQSKADSSSYQDSDATPSLLQAAVDSVNEAITACASELFSRIKKNSLAINFALMNSDPKKSGHMTKFELRSFLCHILFKGFEESDAFFSASQGLPLFEKPVARKRAFFHVYKLCRDVDANQLLNIEQADFAHFVDVKESELCKGLNIMEQRLVMDERREEEFIPLELRSRNDNDKFRSKLLRLLKAVWVLHRLAFAFQPSAEIFRVAQGSVFDEEFMENVAMNDDDDEEDNAAPIVKHVSFMCVPGFTVRHTIIKSRVLAEIISQC